MDCIKRRLLYACGQSYYPDTAIAGRDPGWLSKPEMIKRDAPHWTRSEPIDVAFAGRIAEGVLVALRGTLPPLTKDQYASELVVLDWANDADFLCAPIVPFPGDVHDGFARSLDRLWADGEGQEAGQAGLEKAVDALLNDGRGPRALFVTGHSKGGALANLFAWRARSKPEWKDVPIRVVTFAAARTGNGDFRRAYEATDIRCTRYEVALDAVPLLPFGLDTPAWVKTMIRGFWPHLLDGSYEPIGNRIPARPTWSEWAAAWGRHFRSLFAARSLQSYLPAVVAAHSIGAGSDYDRLVCTGEAGCAPNHKLDP